MSAPYPRQEQLEPLGLTDPRRLLSRFVDWATDVRLRRQVMKDCAFPTSDVKEFLLVNQLAHNGPMRPVDLANSLSQTKTTISKLLHRVEALGLIRRIPADEDGRGVLVVLTVQGTEIGVRVLARMAQEIDSVFELWEPDEVATFQRQLARLVHDLESRSSSRGRLSR